jgi:phage N-6-adenine-methyltransferase
MSAAEDTHHVPSLVSARIEKARDLLTSARSIEDWRVGNDAAQEVAEYGLRRDLSTEAHIAAWELVQLSNRCLGQISKELPHGKPGRKPKGDDDTGSRSETDSKTAQLRSLGVTKKRAYELERLADVPDEEFRARLDLGRDKLLRGIKPGAITATTAGSDHDGDAWGTPENYLDAARTVLGGIELDPATNLQAQQRVKAERFYTREDNGLVQPWACRSLWMNPPFSNPLVGEFCNRFAVEFGDRQIGAGIVLVNACTETGWFQRLLGFCAVCFPDERISFLDAAGNPVKGNAYRQALFYAGDKLPLFAKTFKPFGRVLIEYQGRGARS